MPEFIGRPRSAGPGCWAADRLRGPVMAGSPRRQPESFGSSLLPSAGGERGTFITLTNPPFPPFPALPACSSFQRVDNMYRRMWKGVNMSGFSIYSPSLKMHQPRFYASTSKGKRRSVFDKHLSLASCSDSVCFLFVMCSSLCILSTQRKRWRAAAADLST